jgi:hypothetical protein
VKGCVLFVSVHMGPYQSIVPLEREFDRNAVRYLLGGLSKEARQSEGGEYWDMARVEAKYGTLNQFFRAESVRAVVIGTSDGVPDGNVEERAVQEAEAANVFVFVVEDFPGNYQHRPNCRLDGLFVEDDLLRDVHGSRGVPQDRIYCTGNPRYDALRMLGPKELRRKTRAALGIGEEIKAVLWAGQPDGDNSYRTLERLLPHLPKREVRLLFKAHPRDRLYREGAYEKMLGCMPSAIDVTSEKETSGLCCAADLVITQFSSVGVEASYLGTPTLYVLFDDLGKAYLRQHKGYDCVPWAMRDAAFLLDSSFSPVGLRAIIRAALFDEASRQKIRENFTTFYGSRPASTQTVAAVIRRTLSGSA